MNKRIEQLKRLLEKDIITDNDILELSVMYPDFKPFLDSYSTLTPIDRMRTVKRLLDTLDGNIEIAVNNYINSILLHGNNSEDSISSILADTKKNLYKISLHKDLIEADGSVVFEEEEWTYMPPTLRKYAGQDYNKILIELNKVTNILGKLYPIARGVLSNNIKASYTKYNKYITKLALDITFKNKVVPSGGVVLFAGSYFLVMTNELGVPVIRTKIFPVDDSYQFPIARKSDVDPLIKKFTPILDNIYDHVEKVKSNSEMINRTLIMLKNDKSKIEIDKDDVTDVLLSILTTITSFHVNASIIVKEFSGFLAASLIYRYRKK